MGMLMGGHIHPVAAAADTIDLQAMSCDHNDAGSASCEMRVYNVGTNDGEQWADEAGVNTYQNDTIVPGSNADEYQMKWEALSGDNPNTGSTPAVSTWQALSGQDFVIGWSVGSPGDRTGSVTVSIRKGTGSTLATAVWDGEAIADKTGK